MNRTSRFFLKVAGVSLALAITFTACEGPEGPAGPAGEAGEAGKDGETPEISISDDGYWIIDGDTTDVKAKGEKGEDGVCIPCQNGSSSSVTPSSSSVGCPAHNSATHFCDERDYQIYGYKLIGELVWMTENLNYVDASWDNDGTNTNSNLFPSDGKGSWCYNNDPENCLIYGRLYSWNAAMDDACPAGWHLPERDEFYELIRATGGTIDGWNISSGAAEPLMAESITSGTNESGFSALNSGVRSTAGTYGSDNYMWTATPHSNNTNALRFEYGYSSFRERGDAAINSGGGDTGSGAAVRCVKDAN